jgi:hypothetical protein
MSIAERAKRAMLAEAIEDNILAKEIQLEELIGENCILPTDPELATTVQRYFTADQGGAEAIRSTCYRGAVSTVEFVGKSW